MACPDLRATQGPEEEVGSLARACARFVPNFGPDQAAQRRKGREPPKETCNRGRNSGPRIVWIIEQAKAGRILLTRGRHLLGHRT